jgi:hypothetical protein
MAMLARAMAAAKIRRKVSSCLVIHKFDFLWDLFQTLKKSLWICLWQNLTSMWCPLQSLGVNTAVVMKTLHLQ